jgi:hypothetical protein
MVSHGDDDQALAGAPDTGTRTVQRPTNPSAPGPALDKFSADRDEDATHERPSPRATTIPLVIQAWSRPLVWVLGLVMLIGAGLCVWAIAAVIERPPRSLTSELGLLLFLGMFFGLFAVLALRASRLRSRGCMTVTEDAIVIDFPRYLKTSTRVPRANVLCVALDFSDDPFDPQEALLQTRFPVVDRTGVDPDFPTHLHPWGQRNSRFAVFAERLPNIALVFTNPLTLPTKRRRRRPRIGVFAKASSAHQAQTAFAGWPVRPLTAAELAPLLDPLPARKRRREALVAIMLLLLVGLAVATVLDPRDLFSEVGNELGKHIAVGLLSLSGACLTATSARLRRRRDPLTHGTRPHQD